MNYNCNYILKKYNGVIKYHYNDACFSSFYNYITDYEKITYYISIESFNNGYVVKFEESLILEYNELLKKLGLNFEYLGKTESTFQDYKNFQAYAYEIVFNTNSIRANKVLLNFLRYLYEGNYPTLVENVFKLLKLDLPECLFNIFILAHYNGTQPGGHDIRGAFFYKLFEDEESYFKWLNQKVEQRSSILGKIPKFNNNPKHMSLHKTFKTDLMEFYKEYKQLKDEETKVNEKVEF